MTVQAYSAQVFNESGYILFTPQVASGPPLQSVPPNPYAESATQLFPLGTKLIQGERVWRYCKADSTALNIAAPTQQRTPPHGEQDDDIACSHIAAIGATTIELTSTTNLDDTPNNVADEFKDGYLIINDATGEGQMYKIKANEAFSTTAHSIFTLYDPLTIATAAGTTECGLIRNPYYRTIVAAAPVTGMPTGVPLIAVTASYYYWSQTGGPAPIIVTGAIALGTPVIVGKTAGNGDAIQTYTTGQMVIGYMMTPGVTNTEYAIVFLKLDN